MRKRNSKFKVTFNIVEEIPPTLDMARRIVNEAFSGEIRIENVKTEREPGGKDES